ncbi:DUF1707 and DUF4870 domain-containing protein [Microbispora sp. RL4-1S]|uniref:DUF1707 and DUF4870 domain-containing protein n=1 Tax=Microbispora oryzae TaxID=2806554 RepID=A0A940WNJ1_9ACTN|nr:DUF1707 and DUF4870 domain-containing protein [Microbispora oryzae]MBP2706657.1 DUF1707 and DUF4870 domain-containing protein [Microbispora oryzae]
MPHPHLRVTDKDREQVVEHVKGAFSEGRLDKAEMDERLHLAMTARTHADLVPIMNDLYGYRPAYIPRPPASGARTQGYAAQPSESGERLLGAAAHLLPLLGFFLIGPLIVLLTAGRTSPSVRGQAVEALNFQLTMLGATIVLPFTVIGLVLVPFIWIVGFVLWVVAGVSALAGNEFRYPLTLRPVK